jgi:2-polyprenyl-3-methyl-5-hydroxy-6-metoxy-1,4-benzoquinol methylase
MSSISEAQSLHKNVPPDWYYSSLQTNVFQSFWHKTRFKQIRRLITPVPGKVLDIGCADGVFSKVILDGTGCNELIGIDVLESSVDWANNHWKVERMKFQVGDAHNLEFDDDYFDAVFAMESLEHILEPKKVLQEIKRVLKPNGYVILLVPTDNLLFRIIWSIWTKFKGKIWNDSHVQSFDNNQNLGKFAEENGFSIIKEKYFLLGMLYAVKLGVHS